MTNSKTTMILRHSISDILIHWSNAVLFIILLLTGIGLIEHPELSLFGPGYPVFLRSLVGGGGALLTLHIVLGCLWLGALTLYVLVNFSGARFFLREVFRLTPGDGVWLFRKMFHMTLGRDVSAKMGISQELPEQGYYNAGQKAFAVISVIGGICIAVSGVLLALSTSLSAAAYPTLVGLMGWILALHHFSVWLVVAGLFVHIYMAAFSLDERPGFRSMFSGRVPEDYARHHHPLWKF